MTWPIPHLVVGVEVFKNKNKCVFFVVYWGNISPSSHDTKIAKNWCDFVNRN